VVTYVLLVALSGGIGIAAVWRRGRPQRATATVPSPRAGTPSGWVAVVDEKVAVVEGTYEDVARSSRLRRAVSIVALVVMVVVLAYGLATAIELVFRVLGDVVSGSVN
jgi:hypothetical protein